MATNPHNQYFDEEGNPVGRETVSNRFETIDSVEAKAYAERDIKQKQVLDEQMNKAIAEEEFYAAQEVEEQRIRTLQERSLQQQALMRERTAVEQGAKKGVRGISSFARWGGIGVAFTAWTWQFVCAAISLVGIGLWGSLDYLLNENFIGKAVNTVAKWVGFDFQKLFPVEYLALGFWALATLIGLCTFIGFMLWFYLTGVRMFRTTASTLIAALVFASFILPVSNLFPGILLWVIYVNAMETASMLSRMKKKLRRANRQGQDNLVQRSSVSDICHPRASAR